MKGNVGRHKVGTQVHVPRVLIVTFVWDFRSPISVSESPGVFRDGPPTNGGLSSRPH